MRFIKPTLSGIDDQDAVRKDRDDRYKVVSNGSYYLLSLERKGGKREGVPANEIKIRIIETLNSIFQV